MLITPDQTPAIPPSDDEVSGPHVGPPSSVTRKAPTPDPDGRWWTARASTVAANPTPTPDEVPVLDETAPMPDLQPSPLSPPDTQAASAIPTAIVGALAAPAPGGGPSLFQQLVGVAGGNIVILVGLALWGGSKLLDHIDNSVAAAIDKRAAVEQLDKQRQALDAERQRKADEDAHAKLHDDEARAVDARLDKLLAAMERQEAKLDELQLKITDLQPKRR